MRLNVFISWSKQPSLDVARELRSWIRALFQEVDPRMSENVASGPMMPQLSDILRNADVLIICMASNNWREPWLFYEAGMAYGKSEGKAKVLPYIIDLRRQRRKLLEPLKQFRAYKADENGTYDLVCEINRSLTHPLSELELKTSFDLKWPELRKVVEDAQVTGPWDPRMCLKDHVRVKNYIEGHHGQLKTRLPNCILVAIKDKTSKVYDRDKIIDMAWKEIEESKEVFRNKKSILVGNVADFFGAGFDRATLEKIVESMESELLSSRDMDKVARKLVERIEVELGDAFRSFNSSLSERLLECLGTG